MQALFSFLSQSLLDIHKTPSFGRLAATAFLFSAWSVGTYLGIHIAMEHPDQGIEWLLAMAGIGFSLYTGTKLGGAVEMKAKQPDDGEV
jgi:hypothetical protein